MREPDPMSEALAAMHAYVKSLRGKYAYVFGGKTAIEIKAEDRADELARDKRRERRWLRQLT